MKVPPSLPHPASYQNAGPSMPQGPDATVVFNYINPATGERVVSLLPPDHPQMICLQEGGHVHASKFGFLGE